MTTVGEALVRALVARGVDTIFGIPGVHTIELYRGLADSGIRHVTPRHEQGAGFMADGYARASGKPGVALVITGPGLTNTLTAMAQARADSVPVLVLSGVNARDSLGQGLGYLHELPDQRTLAAGVALSSERVETPDDLCPAIDRALARLAAGRPGPVHVEVPIDVAGLPVGGDSGPAAPVAVPRPDPAVIADAAGLLATARAPVILAGGGMREGAVLAALAERLGAPVVQTVNGRGRMHAHPLVVPASPSLRAVRDLLEGADVVLALGTELGPTDYDMYGTGGMPRLPSLVRVDICPDQLARHPARIAIMADASDAAHALLRDLGPDAAEPARAQARAAAARDAAWDEIGPKMRAEVRCLDAMREAVPGALIVGDSTQPVYAGNLFYDPDRAGGWFNSATGYGALGYAIPAAIGAAIARPDLPVLCLTGDGGAQFSLAELMTAAQEALPVTFVIWNNRGYGEIATSMRDAGAPVIGCDPTPPDFADLARACGMPHAAVAADPAAIAATLRRLRAIAGPSILEIRVADVA
ncbi:5-guanidino-2-oxopentanoate decarboxylase [Palleronia sp. KMU-117]|uniref:5-guanidino-2-oxopentanoate decarboxylase n=1 Tax=Palleronia sp. KMU-117 TaxID=3434108 RepID=UPI003D75A21C